MSKPNTIQLSKNKSNDILSRLNYLSQLSMIYCSKNLLPLSRFYGSTFKKVAKRSVTRIDKDYKRKICKICNTPLIPGLTAEKPFSQIECNTCKTKKKFSSDVKPNIIDQNNDKQNIVNKPEIVEVKIKESIQSTDNLDS